MIYKLISSDPLPITLDQTKTFLNVAHEHHDKLIQQLMDAAVMYCESFTGNSYRKQQFQLNASITEMAVGITLAKNPVTKLNFIDVAVNGNFVRLENNQFVFESAGSRSFIVIVDNQILRNAETKFNSVQVEFEVDYIVLPEQIRKAMLSLVAYYYENRGDAAPLHNSRIPSEVLGVLEQDRVLFL